jgi:hypothetical protein
VEGKTVHYRRDAASEGLTVNHDVHIHLFPLRDGITEAIVKLVQRWTKNNKDPENSVYALVILTALDSRLTPEQARGSSLQTRQIEIRHCRGHLNSTTPKWCAIPVYCHALISPGVLSVLSGQQRRSL